MELHGEVGPARTTVAEIARRAGVSRLTVYNHFPEERQLIAACSAHFLSVHPPPDIEAALALADPCERIRQVLLAFYARYRATEAMTANVQRDRDLVPALDAVLRESIDARLEQLTGVLTAGRSPRREPDPMIAAMTRVALEFATWQRLNRMGLDDEAAAALMGTAVEAAGA